mmetsp:Transcript_31079/g.75116  ORF Transcript_31079/g.75116 Transcript_31079/m.75116 type:complete len:188 (+) Transcript_31079:304-867(+)
MCQSYHPSSVGVKRKYQSLMTIDLAHLRTTTHREMKVPRKVERSVQFSPKASATVRAYERDSSDMFYSSSDLKEMRAERKRTVRVLHARYAVLQRRDSEDNEPCNSNVGEAAAFEGCVLTGIENHLTPDVLARSIKRRIGCVRAVLEEQARQVEAGERDLEGIARASQGRSRSGVRRARTIGFHQSR